MGRPGTAIPKRNASVDPRSLPIGSVEGPGTSEQVRSPFRGQVMGMLAEPGERVREGQPVAWLRIA